MNDYKFTTAPTSGLTADAQTFSFSCRDDGEEELLKRSLLKHGVLRPLLAVTASKSTGCTVVDGARRLKLAVELGFPEVPVLLLGQRGPGDPSLWDRLLAERLAEGSPGEGATVNMNPAETGLYLKKRAAAAGGPSGAQPGALPAEVFEALGMAPRSSAVEEHLFIASLAEPDMLRFATGELQLSAARVLMVLNDEDRDAILSATRGLRLGVNKFNETTRWMSECAWREGVPVGEWLAANSLPGSAASGPELREAVFRLRYPKLALWSESFDREVKRAKLPKGANVSHATNFEGGALRLTLSFKSLDELSERCDTLSAMAREGALETLEKYLG